MSGEEDKVTKDEGPPKESERRLRREEKRLARLEERLARGEISEETYREIKERYEASGAESDVDEEEDRERRGKPGEDEIGALVEESIAAVMERVGERLESVFGSEEFEQRMADVGGRVEEALRRIGPRVEAGGRRIVISGAGVVSSDTPIDEFKCSGSGTVTSDLLAKEVRVSGACKIKGACESDEFHSSGSVKVGSDLRAQEFHSSGSTKIASDLVAREVVSSGTLVVGGSILEAEEVSTSGKLNVGQWVRAQEFQSSGRFRIGKGLEAQDITVRLSGTSKVPKIVGQNITIRQGRRDGDLVVDTIEGQDIFLEGTRADLVRGTSVRIGRFCNIGAVEAEELEVHETSTVKEQRKPTEDEGSST